MNLKDLRVKAGYTQKGVAEALKIKQPTYQRWESTGEVPKGRVAELAQIFRVSEREILGRSARSEATYGDPDAPAELSYFGEVSIHFIGPGAPIVLSISQSEADRIEDQLEGDAPFIEVRSLVNQTVVIRKSAISDLYLSEDSMDTVGPRGVEYDSFLGMWWASARDWEIAERMIEEDNDDLGERYDIDEILKVVNLIAYPYQIAHFFENSSRTYDQSKHTISKENGRNEEKKKHYDDIVRLIQTVQYQLSDGKIRSEDFEDDGALNEALGVITETPEAYKDGGTIKLELVSGYRAAFVNVGNIDYIMVPTHRFVRGREWVMDEDIALL